MRQVPEVWGSRAVHVDPDLGAATPTYGDVCRSHPRAFALRKADSGDRILFLARLEDGDDAAGFYLVGLLVIEEVIADLIADPGPGWWDGNAHVLRSRAHGWDSSWIFKGGPGTGFFKHAQPFGRGEAEAALGRLNWRPGRSELQTIASYTRTIRRIE